MTGSRGLAFGHTARLARFVLIFGLAGLVSAGLWLGSPVAIAADPLVRVRRIEPPAEWNSPEHAARWMQVPAKDGERFQQSLSQGAESPPRSAPFLLDAVYRATFDGTQLTEGTFDWQLDRIQPEPGFVSLGASTLAVSQLKWPTRDAMHGTTSSGDWKLWSETQDERLTGRWSHRGESKLEAVVFEMALPQALSSRLEIRVPDGWEAGLLNAVGSESLSPSSTDSGVWKFELGRMPTFQLRLQKTTASTSPRILLRENTVYGLTTTDDLIRLRTDLDGTVDGTQNADLLLSLPKTLRVFNVLLGNEIPLAFERELGSEEDRLRIPLRSLAPGHRFTLRILGESPRRSDRSFSAPRLRPVGATLQEGSARVAVDRPLEIRTIEAVGLRQTQMTEEAGQESRTYEILSNDCRLELQVGEPSPLLQGEMLFIADVRGESPSSRVRVRLSTREGELFSPQMLIPDGWDVISVVMADAADAPLAAWQMSTGPSGDRLLDLELRQPIRPDRDCTLLLELKAVALKAGMPRRLPIPRLRDAQNCPVRGVIWDNSPWELDELSTGTIELDGTAADDELIQAVHWSRTEDALTVPTGVRIPVYDGQVKPLFRAESSTPADPGSLPGGSFSASAPALLCASLELETRTARVGKSHPHRAVFEFSRPTSTEAFHLTLPTTGELTRIMADDREVSFVRRESEVVLDPAAKPFHTLVLEYRTPASPGWMISRDEIVLPQLDCFITEFAWHLILDPERRLYRLPLTAAVTPQEQPRPWERLLGPLARHIGETWFNPLSKADWKSLINGTMREGSTTRANDLWFVLPRIPERVNLKTWNIEMSHGLAWCGFLGSLVFGLGLRRARRAWFRRGWIYLGGACLVIAVFVTEPFAPIAGGAFLGSVLAILIPRRFAIGRDWLTERRQQPRSSTAGRAGIITGWLLFAGVILGGSLGTAQEFGPPPELEYFKVQENGEDFIVFEARYRPQWNAWHERDLGPAWLLKSSRYEVQADVSGPPRVTATYEVVVLGDRPAPLLRLPLSNVSLDQVEGQLDGEPVRLIPASDRQGFVLPLPTHEPPAERPDPPPEAATEPAPAMKVVTRTVTFKFRPLAPPASDESSSFLATIPPLPECAVVSASERWKIVTELGVFLKPTEPIRGVELGPVSRFRLTEGTTSFSPRDNLADVQLRTLLECGPLGARVQLGALASVSDPRSPAEFTLSLPTGLQVQSIKGPALEQSSVDYLPAQTRVTIRLGSTPGQPTPPVEIIAFLPVSPAGFQMPPPRWIPDKVQQPAPLSAESTPESRREQSFMGVVAKPGFMIAADASPRTSVASISPQSFSDALFAGIVWQVPDLAWTCSEAQGPAWTVSPIASTSRALLSQTITLQTPQSDWQLEATISTAQGVPFEHLFRIDPRIEIHRATVQQDGADRLLRWTRMGEQVRLSIRDGQPGTQTIRIEGAIAQGAGPWMPPVCDYRSGLTTESTVTVRNSSRAISTLRWVDSTTRLRPNDGQSDEEVRYRPGTIAAPSTILVEPVAIERFARAWIHLVPQHNRPWQVTLHVQLKDTAPFAAPVQIHWDQPGLTEMRQANRRDHVRQSGMGQELLWRPQAQSSKPAELSLSAVIEEDSLQKLPLLLPQFSGITWSEIWVSFPREAAHRPARTTSTLLTTAPAQWPATWTDGLSSLRADLYTCAASEVPIEATTSEPLVRPVIAEAVMWLGEAPEPNLASRDGISKYLLIAERDVTLEVPPAALPMIRAISVDGQMQAAESTVRVPSKSNDLSHEVIVWWHAAAGQSPPDPSDMLRVPGGGQFPVWIAVVPPHDQVLLDHWGRGTPLLHEFWLQRSESLLRGALEFRGAPWSVDGPLLHHLAQTRDEVHQAARMTPAEATRRDLIDQQWKTLSQAGGNISSPPAETTPELPDCGLDAVLSLCGESRSLWLRPPGSHDWPQLFDRRWAIVLTAGLASLVSLLVLTWTVRIFRQLDLAEKLAARPHATMIGMGLVWWASLSPSVLGLGMALVGAGLWSWERFVILRASKDQVTNRPM